MYHVLELNVNQCMVNGEAGDLGQHVEATVRSQDPEVVTIQLQ